RLHGKREGGSAQVDVDAVTGEGSYGEVGDAVAVEIAGSYCGGLRAGCVRQKAGKVSGPGGGENRGQTVDPIRHHQIVQPVAVEVGRGDGREWIERVRGLHGEGPAAAADQYRDAAGVGYGQIGNSVAVEIAGCNRACLSMQRESL